MRFVFYIDGTLCFDGRLIHHTIIDTLLQLQHDGHEPSSLCISMSNCDLLPVLPSVFHQHTLIGANGAMISQQSKISVYQTNSYSYISSYLQNNSKYELDYIIDDDWNYAEHSYADNRLISSVYIT
ncbi:HAD hydrolase family protein [Staphylococcus aureus]